jgi:hypothetical protein
MYRRSYNRACFCLIFLLFAGIPLDPDFDYWPTDVVAKRGEQAKFHVESKGRGVQNWWREDKSQDTLVASSNGSSRDLKFADPTIHFQPSFMLFENVQYKDAGTWKFSTKRNSRYPITMTVTGAFDSWFCCCKET